jgi:NADH:ubiquinone oxidoreductase subunit 4 (subunit M)
MRATKSLVQFKKIKIEPQQKEAFIASFLYTTTKRVPIYFLIALWGHKGAEGKSRVYAATKFFIYTQVAGLIMLIGILGLVVYGYMMTGMIGFDYNYLLAVANTPKSAVKPTINRDRPSTAKWMLMPKV